jgi:hypothetical protein
MGGVFYPGVVVGDDKAVPVPLIAQNAIHEVAITACRNAIDCVVGAHGVHGAGLDNALLEDGHVHLPHATRIDNGVEVEAVGGDALDIIADVSVHDGGSSSRKW